MPEMAGWLDNLGVSEYAEHFAENKIDVRQHAAADGAGHGGDVERSHCRSTNLPFGLPCDPLQKMT
jgi:hypothetical protein